MKEKSVTHRASSGRPRKLTAETGELFSQIQGRLEPFDSASMIWHNYLSDRERTSLGGNLEDAWRQFRGTLGMVSHARQCSEAEALLWLCEEMETLPAARIRSLRKELGLPRKSAPKSSPSDVWNKVRGELSLDGNVIRKIRSANVATRVVTILDAFETNGWCERIENPLKSGDAHAMRQAIYSLNKSLKVIRFNADGTSGGIRWNLR